MLTFIHNHHKSALNNPRLCCVLSPAVQSPPLRSPTFGRAPRRRLITPIPGQFLLCFMGTITMSPATFDALVYNLEKSQMFNVVRSDERNDEPMFQVKALGRVFLY